MTQKNVQIIREAGLLERYHITRHLLGLDSCVIVAALFTGPEKLYQSKQTLFSALRIVSDKHAALRVRLFGEAGNNPSYSLLRNIDFSKIVEFSSDHQDWGQLRHAMELQFLQSFRTEVNLPLWRLIVLRDNTLLFAWHHCIGDGLSGIAFHREFLAALNNPQTSVQECADDITACQLAPAIENVLDISPSWRKICREAYDLFVPALWTRGSSAWTGNPVKVDPNLHTHVRLLEFPAEEIIRFRLVCRKQNATLTSAFYTLAVSVLSVLIINQNPKSNPPSTISTFVPISLRGLAGTSSDVFCEHVTAHRTYPSIDSAFSWNNASEYASRLHLESNKSKEEIGMLKYLFGKYETFFKAKIGSKRQGGLELSNLGHFDVDSTRRDTDRWSIEKVSFAQCDSVCGSAIKLNVVGAPTGGITIAVTWGDGAVADSFVEEFVSDFQIKFREILFDDNE